MHSETRKYSPREVERIIELWMDGYGSPGFEETTRPLVEDMLDGEDFFDWLWFDKNNCPEKTRVICRLFEGLHL